MLKSLTYCLEGKKMSETYVFQPKGVCSRRYTFELDGDTIESVKIDGGCAGNLLGISKIIRGMKIDEVIEDFLGTPCGRRPTSCPDQIAIALKTYKEEHNL